MDYTLPIAKRTRSCEDQMYRRIHEEMMRKKGTDVKRRNKNNSNNNNAATDSTSLSGFSKVNYKGKSSSSGSCQKSNGFGYGCDYGVEKEVSESTSFGGYNRKFKGQKRTEKKNASAFCSKGGLVGGNSGWGDDSSDEICLVDDSDENEEKGFDFGSSNFESNSIESLRSDDDDVKKRSYGSGRIEVEESCSGWKSSSNGEKDDNDDDIVEISGSESEEIKVLDSEEESDEEDDDGSDDEDYRGETSESSVDFNSSSSGDEEEESKFSGRRGKRKKDDHGDGLNPNKKPQKKTLYGSEDHEVEVVDEEESKVSSREIDYKSKGNKIKMGLERKRRSRMDSYDSDSKIEAVDDVGTEFGSVSKRSRSQYHSKSSKKRTVLGRCERPLSVEEDDSDDFASSKKRTELRMNDRPLCVEEDESDYSDDEIIDETSGPGLIAKKRKAKLQSMKKKGDKLVEDLQPKKKRIAAYDDEEVVKILGNSMFDNDEVLLEKIDEPVIEPSLPLKFSFETEEEKFEDDNGLDNLWAEMALALCSKDALEVDQNSKGENDVALDAELDAVDLCNQGKHQFVLDEEIGIKCRFCSFVDLEIKYCTAPFGKNSSGYSERRDYYGENRNILDQLRDQDHGHDSKHNSCLQGTVWSIIPGIEKDLHEHQREGFEFLWKNIAGGIHLDKLKEPTCCDGGSGCIISHAPGTGKTRLAIVFLQSYMKLYPSCRPLIIAPCSMLLSWEAEFKKWKVDIPFHNLNKPRFCGKENTAALRLVESGQCSLNSTRMVKLYSWRKDTSVLGISYKLFEELVGEDKKRSKARQKSEDDVRKALLELPGLLVLDEGHTPRNEQSLIFKALSNIRTDKRIILSGTPFQNNFVELFNTLLLVRPRYSDLLLYKCHGFHAKKKRGRKIVGARETWATLTSFFGKDGNEILKAEKLEEIRNVIKPFVHVHRGNILQQRLPGLRDAVVIFQPVHLQKCILDKVQGAGNPQSFSLEYLISVASIHPSLICEKQIEGHAAEFDMLEKHKLNSDMGVKTRFLMELVELSGVLNEKVLVFSQYLDPLKLIGQQLESRFNWIQGKEILHMHGAVDTDRRQSLIKHFNDRKSEAKVLLASTKACSEGINLVGASRVVLLDVVWNPSVERQAISRAYRLGQEKVVYIYHLIASGTMEEDKYCRQAEKERLSELVFYSADRVHNSQKISSKVSDDKKDELLELIVQRNRLKDILKRIIYEPKDSNLDDSWFA